MAASSALAGSVPEAARPCTRRSYLCSMQCTYHTHEDARVRVYMHMCMRAGRAREGVGGGALVEGEVVVGLEGRRRIRVRVWVRFGLGLGLP